MHHDGDHVDHTDAVLGAVALAEARARHGVPGPVCTRIGCSMPAEPIRFEGQLTGTHRTECEKHERETNAMLDRSWPPTIE